MRIGEAANCGGVTGDRGPARLVHLRDDKRTL
jgi:hypothetical protein